MIEIIKRGNANRYICECPKCNTFFSYDQSDEEYFLGAATAYCIKCPICGYPNKTRTYIKSGTEIIDRREMFGS